jgi:glycosyltransferase involved in cell wall biosynthesis
MDKSNRQRIGIIFNFTKGWLGGFYYYQNIIKALNFLEDEEKPEILVFYNRDYSDYISEIQYPYLQLIPWHFPNIYKSFLMSIITRKHFFVDEMIKTHRLSAVYPVNDYPVSASKTMPVGTRAVAWVPDLQHKFFPMFFDKKRLWLRELRLRLTLKNATDLVVSSYDTLNHFKQFYAIPKKLRIHVLQFVSLLDDFEKTDIEKLKLEYKIPPDYFIVSNGFLKHKNHFVVLKALKVLQQQNKMVHIVFTGKMEAYADSSYIDQLKDFIQSNSLGGNVSLLGIIPRDHQLCIMKNAQAVLQPSMFEGWNTTIEDAKSLQLPIIASSIDVHKEQLDDKGIYFDPANENDLARILLNFKATNGHALYTDYNERIKIFARAFLDIFKNVTTK